MQTPMSPSATRFGPRTASSRTTLAGGRKRRPPLRETCEGATDFRAAARFLPSAHVFRGLVRDMDDASHFLPVESEQKLDNLGGGVQRWEIDTSRSTLTFSLPHLLVQQVRGRFDRWEGTLVVHPKQQRLSQVEIRVALSSVTTGDLRRDARIV